MEMGAFGIAILREKPHPNLKMKDKQMHFKN
jgi:hypothetical protein